MTLERFFVTTIVKPDGEKAYESFKDIHIRQYTDLANAHLRQKVGIINQQTDAQRMVIESQAIAQKRAQEGYSYQQERGFDVAEKVAQNEGIGNITNAGIGLGMMGGVAGGMGAVVAGITTDALNPVTQQSAAAHEAVSHVAGFNVVPPTTDLTNEAAEPEPSAPQSSLSDEMTAFKQRLEKLKMMKEAGFLSDAEFDDERKKVLASL